MPHRACYWDYWDTKVNVKTYFSYILAVHWSSTFHPEFGTFFTWEEQQTWSSLPPVCPVIASTRVQGLCSFHPFSLTQRWFHDLCCAVREHQQPCGLHQFHMPAVPSPWELSAFLPHSSLQYRPSTINTNIMPWYFPLLPHPGIGFTLESTVLFSPASSASFWSPKPSAIIASGKSAGWHLYPPCPSYCISPNQCNFSKIQGHLHIDPILRILQTLQECARLNIYHQKFPVTIPQPLPQPSIVPARRQSHDTTQSSPPTSHSEGLHEKMQALPHANKDRVINIFSIFNLVSSLTRWYN